MIKLKNIFEIILLEDEASDEAHKHGLVYSGWGKWEDKSGNTVAKTEDGKFRWLTDDEKKELNLNKQSNQLIQNKKQIANIILGTKIGNAGGTNKGGVYKGTDGIDRYVKFYSNPGHGAGEHLANSIYRELGIAAPESTVFENDDKLIYASKLIPKEGDLNAFHGSKRKEIDRKILNGFAADVLTANWDVIGFEDDNIAVTEDLEPVRIDNGSSFLYRAQGERKSDSLLNQITEVNGFLNPNINSNYYSVYKNSGIGKEEFKSMFVDQIKQISQLQKKYGGWENFVSRHGKMFPLEEKKKIIEMLNSRTKKLMELIKK